MKIRIQGNSIRLRLTKTEVDLFSGRGVVKETTHLGGTTLTYQLVSKAMEKMTAVFENNIISIIVPIAIANQWTSTEQVGFEAEVKYENGESVSILVEKDFQCLAPRAGEDESDLFKNPLMEE